MKSFSAMIATLTLALSTATAAADTSVLFIGNSFTFGYGSAARYYRADTVTDLNNLGIGGVPALFKSFTEQAGLDYEVALETEPGSGLDFHLANRLSVIGRRPWDQVVMHGYSTLDRDNPGDPIKLASTTKDMSEFLQSRNSQVEVFLTATWSRADQIYIADRPWTGTPIEEMALDLRAAYDKAAAGAPSVKSVIAVGEAWTRAMQAGAADPNPYDGIDLDKFNLWTWDHYHASSYGYYLEALMAFGNLTGLDPRSLGDIECSGFELGLSRTEIKSLQQAAFDQLAAEGLVKPSLADLPRPASPQRCVN